MLNLFRAELHKIVGNRWTTGFLLWVFPIGSLGIILFLALMTVTFDPFYDTMFDEPMQWTTMMLAAWAFPSNPLGQMFLVGLTAVSFAGEYQWGTWKNVIPQRSRTALLGIKFFTLSTLIIGTFLLTSVILGLGYGFITVLGGDLIDPPVNRAVLTDLLSDYGAQAALTFLSVLIVSIYVALAASFMRSVIGGVMVGLGFVIVEPMIAWLMAPLALAWDQPLFLELTRLTPTYNIGNITSWINQNKPNPVIASIYQSAGWSPRADTTIYSLVVLTGWVIVGLALNFWVFQRQDITS